MSETGPPEPVHPRAPDPLVEPRPSKSGSDLPARLATAAILVPAVLYVIVQGGLLYLGVVMLFVILGQLEFYRLLEEKGAHPFAAFGVTSGAALPVVAYLGNEYHATLIMNAGLLAVMVRSVGRAEISQALASISGTFFGVFYIGWLLSHIVVLRNFYDVATVKYGIAHVESLRINPDTGIFYTIFCLTAVVFADAGAYFGGRAWGRRKLAPRISPGKTIEGAFGGLLGGLVGALGLKLLFDLAWPEMSAALGYGLGAAMAFVVAVFAIVGDLVESLIKRDAKAKDAGSLLPGMGGILDRIDSPLLGVPVMYYMLLLATWLRMGPP